MDAVFTPRMIVDYYAAREGIDVKDIGVAPIVLIVWGGHLTHRLAEAIGGQPSEHWLYGGHQPLFTGQVHGKRVSLARPPIGAAGTVTMMEELIACGARIFLGLGLAGSLQRDVPVGSMLIPTACLSEEGTSAHYVADAGAIAPDAGLVAALKTAAGAEDQPVLTGALWTTDAPYRETRHKVRTYGQRGVLGVDMETSAMYALGIYRRVRVCNLLVVSDELAGEWRAAFGAPELHAATDRAMQVLLHCLAGDLSAA